MIKKREISLTEDAYGLKGISTAITLKIANARNGEHLQQQNLKALMEERAELLHRVCLFINEINTKLNLAASNIYARLPPDEYKDHVEARRIARAVKAQLEKLVHKDTKEDENIFDMYIEDYSGRIILKKRDNQ